MHPVHMNVQTTLVVERFTAFGARQFAAGFLENINIHTTGWVKKTPPLSEAISR